ncbi:MAG TPA: hypothetical protein VGD24_06105 [Gallionella sp.]
MLTISRIGVAVASIFLTVLAGCASDPAYISTADKNLHIENKLIESGFAHKYYSYLYVSEVDQNCQFKYLGYVALDKPILDIGLPTNKPLLLRAEFATFNRFSQPKVSRIDTSYLIQLKPNAKYAADIQRNEIMYKFTLYNGQMIGDPKRRIGKNNNNACSKIIGTAD